MDSELLENIGAYKIPYSVDLKLGDGRIVKAEVYALAISVPREWEARSNQA